MTSPKLTEIPFHQNMLITDLPFAKINLDISFNTSELSQYASPKIGSISPRSCIVIWDEDLIHAELLKTKYTPHIPSHLQVTYCWAYLWRVKSKKNLPSLTFKCYLDPKQPIIDESIETGENLFSKSFSFATECIHIGTEDEERILQRANANDYLPKRFIQEKQIDYDKLIESSILGITVHLPPLHEEELVQLQFVIAGGTDPIANWFAVDAYPSDILLQAGCK